jgi:ATP:corrinoid adenosyltransferase
MKNVFTAGGHDNLSTALVGAAVALVVIGVVVAVHLFMKDRSRAAGAVLLVAFAAAVVSFACSTDAVLVDSDERVDAFVSSVKTTYGLPLTHQDGEKAYEAYRSGEGTFDVDVQGKEYVLRVADKGDDLVLLVLGGEPATS